MNGLSLGYFYMAILVMALYAAIKSRWALPMSLDDKAEPNPVIALNCERMLAISLAMGIFMAGVIAALPLLHLASSMAGGTPPILMP